MGIYQFDPDPDPDLQFFCEHRGLRTGLPNIWCIQKNSVCSLVSPCANDSQLPWWISASLHKGLLNPLEKENEGTMNMKSLT